MRRRGFSLLALVAMASLGTAAGAAAEPLPPFDGAMAFHAIPGPEAEEDFSWQVSVGAEEELRAIDDTHAGVYWVETETLAMTIAASQAHDAEGTTVPTTLAVTQPDVVTLTVHHRAGNPAAGGAPFVYPVSAGAGWEGGFQTTAVAMPPTEQAIAPPAPRCTVPDLAGRSLRASRRQLRRSHCRLGEVRGERSRGARVVKQFRPAGRSLPAGTEVGIKLLTP